jgi:hypothetical protein
MNTVYSNTSIMKTLQIFIFLLIVILTMSMTQCEKEENFADLIIHNTSHDTILWYDKGGEASDTLLWDYNIFPTSGEKEINRILPNSTINLRDEYLPIGNSFVHLFLFSKRQIDTIPWDTIRDNYLILRRYDLSKDDLVNGGWEVSYP